MEVRAKKSLGQHFLTDQTIAQNIVNALQGREVLEVGPGMGVLTQYLLQRPDTTLKAVEIDDESVVYLKKHFPSLGEGLIEGDFLKMDLGGIFPSAYSVIGNFPYNISSQIFFKILEHHEQIPEVVCMLQKEVAERIAEKPGTKVYGILSVFLQAWYDIEYLFPVGPGAFNPPPKVQSAVIRLARNSRASLGCDEAVQDGREDSFRPASQDHAQFSQASCAFPSCRLPGASLQIRFSISGPSVWAWRISSL